MKHCPSDTRLQVIFNTVERHIESRYGIPVIIKDVPTPFTGDLDGAEIHVDYDLSMADAVFILVHLFGHTVQWNADLTAREVGMRDYTDADDTALAELQRYEVTACRYSMQLFHEAGVDDCDLWLSDFAACDFAYLDHFYRTGVKRPFMSFWQDDQTRMTPLAIPAFVPTKWETRWDGVVI
ncbi:MAG: hypothetical protein ACI9MR_001037 [Myxococcota bacterium]